MQLFWERTGNDLEKLLKAIIIAQDVAAAFGRFRKTVDVVTHEHRQLPHNLCNPFQFPVGDLPVRGGHGDHDIDKRFVGRDLWHGAVSSLR
jgi:hypothetical protein